MKKVENRNAKTAAKREARENLVNPFKVGDIFYTSWGYDQTNVDWFQCVEVGPKSVLLRAIAEDRTETGWMTGRTTPRKGAFLTAEPFRVNLQVDVYNNEVSVCLPAKHGSYYPWDGTSKHWSSYA